MKRLVPIAVLLCAAGYLTAAGVLAQNKPAAGPLAGAVDIHMHSYPDSQGRSIDAYTAAQQAKAAGMRAIVLKAHYDNTATIAYIIRKAVPGIDVFGGIALNHSMGGVNHYAVERLALSQKFGGNDGARVVYMPTTDAEHQLIFAKEKRPGVSIAKGGQLLPETKNVIAVIAKNNLSLATGHSSPTESLLVIQEARRLGITKIVVTHPMNPAMSMSMAQMQEAAKMGAFLELTARSIFQKMVPVNMYVDAVKKIGAEHFIMSGDLGQENSPLPVKGLTDFVALMRAQGISQADVDTMLRVNPAKWIGLPPAK